MDVSGTQEDLHKGMHSEHGALRGEHPGRSRDPLIKVTGLAWLEFDKPDLSRAAAFARAFGFQTVPAGTDELHLRGTDAGGPCVVIRRGPTTRFRGLAFQAARRRASSSSGTFSVNVRLGTSRAMMSLVRTSASGPPIADSGATCRMHAP